MVTMRYETKDMADIRKRLVYIGYTDEDVDVFRACLASLENQGFRLRKD